MKNWQIILVITVFNLTLNHDVAFSQIVNLEILKSFPTAEGFGQLAGVGQLEREVYYVTNLNDAGPGSFREGVSQSNRLVLFKVAGMITLSSVIEVNGDNIYIAGQTAFYDGGQGITFKSDGIQNDGLLLFTGDHIVVRYIRLRRGPGQLTGEVSGDNINLYGSSDWMLDHCSFSWSTDENVSAAIGAKGTMQYCISSEGLYFSTHGFSRDPNNPSYQTGHSKGSIFGWQDNVADELTFYRNLFAHNDARNPLIFGPGGRFEIVNNLMYNNRYFNIELEANAINESNTMETNVVKNLLIPGSDTRLVRYMVHTNESIYDQIYMRGNIGVHRTNNTMSEWAEVGFDENALGETGRSFVPFITPLEQKYNMLPEAENLQGLVLSDVGASLDMDEVDIRIVNDVINLTPTVENTVQGIDPDFWSGTTYYFGIINDIEEVGGWPVIESMNSIVLDSNSDGIDDIWANAHGVFNWLDIIDTYQFGDMTVNNNAGYNGRQIFLAFLANDFIRIETASLAINEFSVKLPVSIFPNPAEDRLSFETDLKIEQIELIDSFGSKIKIFSTINFNSINLEGLAQGMYFLMFRTSESQHIFKFIKL